MKRPRPTRGCCAMEMDRKGFILFIFLLINYDTSNVGFRNVGHVTHRLISDNGYCPIYYS
jgi:hypothetical protein